METTARKISLFFLCWSLAAGVAGQSGSNAIIRLGRGSSILTVREALQLICSQTTFTPSYVNKQIPFNKHLSFRQEEVPLPELLNAIVHSENLTYEFSNELILIIKKRPLLLPEKTKQITLKGKVTETATGEALIGATIWIDSLQTGTFTNDYGFYSLSLPAGSYHLQISFVGYEPFTEGITASSSQEKNFTLQAISANLPELIISPGNFEVLLLGNYAGHHKIGRNIFGKVPYFLSEVDVIQGALLLPGIRNVGEDAAGVNVRSGSADQNLVLLDEAIIFNTSHFFGLISVFNPDAVNDIEIYKGTIPAVYGGRVSSILNVRQREGNREKFTVSGGVGVLSGRLVVEGPLLRGKSSFLVSGRHSLFGISYGLAKGDVRKSTLLFGDLNLKLNYDLGPRDKIYLSGYMGRDRNKIGDTFQKTWGNNALIARLNHLFGSRLFSNHTFTVSEYGYKTEDPSTISNFAGTSFIFNYTIKSDFNFYLNPSNVFDFGYSFIFHQLNPGTRTPLKEDADASLYGIRLDNELAVEPALYGSWEKHWGSRLNTTAGLRWGRFYYLGPSNVYLYKEGVPMARSSIEDTVRYQFGQIINWYNNMEPRLALSYRLTTHSLLKAGYSRSFQYIHRITNSISPSPTDTWKLSDTYILPEAAHQWSLGYYRELFDKKLEISLEGFYKSIDNTIAFKNGADLELNETIETEILQGVARAYGGELLIRKPEGILRGWLSYTLSKAETKIAGTSPSESINNGAYFPSDFHRTHDLSLAGIYDTRSRWSFSATFNYSTGRPVTLPVSKYEYEGVVVPHFDKRNEGRLPDYHRLDLSATLAGRKKEGKRFYGSWTFSVYNVYARKNAYSYLFRKHETIPGQAEITQYSILGFILPSVSYNFTF